MKATLNTPIMSNIHVLYYLAELSFGSSDEIDRTPVSTTPTSVTLRWREGSAEDLTPFTATFVGYQLYYRKPSEVAWGNNALYILTNIVETTCYKSCYQCGA